MDEFTSAELAYKNGYDRGWLDGFKAATQTMSDLILSNMASFNAENGGEYNAEKENRNG